MSAAIKVAFCLGCLFPAAAFAGMPFEEPRAPFQEPISIHASPYYALVHHTGSATRKTDHVIGLHGALDLANRYGFDTEVSHDRISYRDGSERGQWDFTLVHTNRGLSAWPIRLGAHHIRDDGTSRGDSWTLISSLDHVPSRRWYAGLAFYLSWYDRAGDGLRAYQWTPRLGLILWERPGTSLWLDLGSPVILLDSDVGLGRTSFLSAGARLTLRVRRWSCAAFGWGGEQAFAVRSAGYLVYNLSERHRAGYGAEASYEPLEWARVAARIAGEEVEDASTRTHTRSVCFLVSVGLTL